MDTESTDDGETFGPDENEPEATKKLDQAMTDLARALNTLHGLGVPQDLVLKLVASLTKLRWQSNIDKDGIPTLGGPDEPVVLVGGVRPLRKGYDDRAGKTRWACKRAGLAPLTFHSLRATYATLIADAGLPIGKLSALLGHSDSDDGDLRPARVRSGSNGPSRDSRSRVER